MNCKTHPTTPAVNTCQSCHCGICDSCCNATKDYGTFCIECALRDANQDIALSNRLIKRLIEKSIFLVLFWILGISLFFTGLSRSSLDSVLIGILICGLPTARVFWRIAEDKHDAFEARYGASYTITDNRIYKNQGFGLKFFYAATGLILGLVANPIKVVKNLFTIKSLKDNITRLNALIARWS